MVRFDGFLVLDGFIVAKGSSFGKFLLSKLIRHSVKNGFLFDIQEPDFDQFKSMFHQMVFPEISYSIVQYDLFFPIENILK